METVQRASDAKPARRFQSDRFFLADGMWYFSTREAIDFGPFTERREGEKALQRYIETQYTMHRLRRDPTRDTDNLEQESWDQQAVAEAANDVSRWRLDPEKRNDLKYTDRSGKHR